MLNSLHKSGKLTLGLFFPIEAYVGAVPTMENQTALAQFAEQIGFSTLWFRDVPLLVPTFGDVGQMYDPFTYMGYIAAHTKHVTLATGSAILPLRHPIHLAKSAASVDVLSNGRLALGVASGDRPQEYPAFGIDFSERGALFQENFKLVRQVWESFPTISSKLLKMEYSGIDLLPKPIRNSIPMLVTGHIRFFVWNR